MTLVRENKLQWISPHMRDAFVFLFAVSVQGNSALSFTFRSSKPTLNHYTTKEVIGAERIV